MESHSHDASPRARRCGAVLPLSMYAANTERMIEAMGIGLLDPVPRMFFSIAVTAWCAALFWAGFGVSWPDAAGGGAMTSSAPRPQEPVSS